MTLARQNLIVTGYGPKGSGKSRFLRDMFVRQAPRVISLDVTGEGRESYPEALGPFFGLARVLDGVRAAARWEAAQRAAGRPAGWHILAAIDDREIPRFFRMLAPPFDGQSVSLARALGGVAIECGEVDHIAPNGSADPEVVAAWRRGRHHALSLLTATQRPASCARDVSAQADVLFSFQTSEPRDVAFLADTFGKPTAEVIRNLPRYHAAVYVRERQRVLLLDENRKTYEERDLSGAILTAAPLQVPNGADQVLS